MKGKQRIGLNNTLQRIGRSIYKNGSDELKSAWRTNKTITVPDTRLEGKTDSSGEPLLGESKLERDGNNLRISEDALDEPVSSGSGKIFGKNFSLTVVHETGHDMESTKRQEDIVGVGTAPVENQLESVAQDIVGKMEDE